MFNSKAWRFLNSSIFIWFLSTVVLGLATTIYNNLNKKRIEHLQTEKSINEIDKEIRNRLLHVKYISEFLFDNELIVRKLNNTKSLEISSNLLPKYSNYNFESLLLDLIEFESNPNGLELKSLLPDINKLTKIYYSDSYGQKINPSIEKKRINNKLLLEFIVKCNLNRWDKPFSDEDLKVLKKNLWTTQTLDRSNKLMWNTPDSTLLDKYYFDSN